MIAFAEPSRQGTRCRTGLASTGLVLLFMASCADVQVGGAPASRSAGPNLTSPSPPPGQAALGGGVAKQEPPPPASASPSPSSTAVGPTPFATPAQKEGAIRVSILPASVELSVPPGEGSGPPAGKPYTAQLSALVTMADGSTSSMAIWQSLAPEIATVSATGTVKVLGPGAGTGPWWVGIEARSLDGLASDVRLLKVTAEGEIGVSVE